MLIISKFKDYYDIGNTYGIDKSIVYERHVLSSTEDDKIKPPESITNVFTSENKYNNRFHNLKFTKDSYNSRLKSNSRYEYVSPFIIGFCGKLYLGFKMGYSNNKPYDNDYFVDYEYDIYDVLKHIENKKSHKSKKMIHDEIVELKNEIERLDNIDDSFRKYHSPIFVIDSNYNDSRFGFSFRYNGNLDFIVNTNLSDYRFFKQFDPYLAYQEINMFISGVLGCKDDRSIEISDEYKIASHGYDKWSFRNPEPPKRKRKKNK